MRRRMSRGPSSTPSATGTTPGSRPAPRDSPRLSCKSSAAAEGLRADLPSLSRKCLDGARSRGGRLLQPRMSQRRMADETTKV